MILKRFHIYLNPISHTSSIKKIKTLFIVLSILFCNLIWAQKAYVKGEIKDQTGATIEGIEVRLLSFGDTMVRYSDVNGDYLIPVPADTAFQLSYSKSGDTTIIVNIGAIKKSKTLTKNVNLFTAIELSTATVVGKQTSETYSMDPIKFASLPGPSGDINAILKFLAPVVSNNELSSSYSVRGGSFDENLVYVNEVEVYRPFLTRSGQQEGLSFPNPDMVSNINFSPGGFEAKYGDKMSSVLDITYREPRKFGGSASGSLLGGSLQLEGASKNNLFTWQVGSRYKTNQYLLKAIDTKGDYKPRFYDVQTFLTYDFNDKVSMEFIGNVAGNKYLVVPQTRQTVFGTAQEALQFTVYFDGQEISQYQTYFGALTAIIKPSDRKRDSLRLKFIASAYRANEAETYTVQGQYYIDELENDFGDPNFGNVAFNRGVGTFINNGRNYLNATVLNLEHKGRYLMPHNQQLLWGVRAQHEEIFDQLSEWVYIDSAGYSLPQTNPSTIELNDVLKTKNHISSFRGMAYGEYIVEKKLKSKLDTLPKKEILTAKDSAEARLDTLIGTRKQSKLNFTIGGRTNYWTLNNQNVFSPRTTLSYEPNWRRDWVFRASFGYYYQPPFYREMRNLQGVVNTNLKAQQSIHYVLTGDLNFKIWRRPFRFITSAYYKQLSNLVPYEVDNVRLRYYGNNDSKGYATGVELRLNGEFVKGAESFITVGVMQTREKLKNDFYYTYVDSTGEKWIAGLSNLPKFDSTRVETGYIPRPTDQRVTFNMFFQDYLPRVKSCKMFLNLIVGTGLPFGRPDGKKWDDVQRMPPYRRVDIGFSYELIKENKKLQEKKFFKELKSAWISLEIMNLLQVNNTVSYTWVKDVTNRQYAIPNYLTNRQLNLKLQVRF